MDPEERYMWSALDLARQGLGKTSPNPMVGAVLVKDGEVLGTGFHAKAGGPHAEIVALQEAGEKARGATLYTNLEPCSHHGRTPPCVEAIIQAGVKKVVVAMVDPNPIVSGAGIRRLREAGIKVRVGVLEEKARRLNEVFLKYITTKTPFLIVKMAMTLDGKIAVKSGQSRWITGPKSRKFVHKLRSMSDGIVVGINTLLQDDPLLNVRLNGEKSANPARIIVDSKGRLPLESRVVKTAAEIKTILATTELAPSSKLASLESAGVEVLVLPLKNGRVDLRAMMSVLGKKEISILMAEGGGTLNYSFLTENLIDKIYFFLAPKLVGGKGAPTPLEGEGAKDLSDAWIVEDIEMKQLDQDLLIIGYPVRGEENVHGYCGRTGRSIGQAVQ
ncbi:MAG: bifunctional diaminohydroxyphosphoribosylaminopyrimidine deaminase/5-amino-6-(5-phosphoribosylamino)uracil reductase RibD [Firmicutes bacterium]|nr:bifunctional diaminohydroxyphosphoribosylaminopyrimidine deaminase/5-amino-6-(5-phosphoribosylamino)uracil reductase RibD [Bacillota bacterium]